MADRRVRDQRLEVLLGHGAERAVDHVDQAQDRDEHHDRSSSASGASVYEKRKNPYPPIFSSTPASIIEIAVGASTCASGSHVWNGTIGTLIANPAKRPMKIHSGCEAVEPRRDADERQQVEGVLAALEVEREHRHQHHHRAEQRVDEELDRGVDAARASPEPDQEVHREQDDFPEDVEEEEVERENTPSRPVSRRRKSAMYPFTPFSMLNE